MTWRFLEDVTRADITFEATGKNLNELFASAGAAVLNAMANPDSIATKETREIDVTEDSIEKLLFSFLEDIVYFKDKDSLVFHEITVDVDEKTLRAKATITGDFVDPEKQELHQDVKAVTMHYYTVEKTPDGWRTQVVLDI